jgi:hypothetical protein
MRTRLPHLVFASLFLAGLAASCSKAPIGGGTGSVVLGLTSKLTPGAGIDAMHVVIKAGGNVVVDEERSASAKNLSFPSEFKADDLEDGEPVEATITATSGGDTTPALTRIASTEAIAGKSLLLQVELEGACVQLPGGSAPSCTAPATCIHGVCKDSHVDGSKLPAYTPTWSKKTVDVCKPQGAGDPAVVVGQGQADYLPIDDNATAQVEAGPQGGHHIWVALRLKNLTQSGSITSLTGHFPELGYDVGPFNVIFTFDPDEGGYCKIYGLRFQLDIDHDIHEMLGKTFEITATIKDKDGDVGTGKKTVKLSSDILGQ